MNRLLIGMFLCLPMKHWSLSSAYGYRVHPVNGLYSLHNGIDLRSNSDTVFAVLSGTVQAVGYGPVSGVYIRIDHGDFQSAYGHLSRAFVMPRDAVSKGNPIGITGATGRVTGEHLHFSMQFRHRLIDPAAFMLSLIKLSNQ
ncbi:M23 family metallopeptidase [Mucilaginibacter sp. KACC 22773]|uniref:M23 family metallopeptidase n=1 Tax=Mucilaginibacter sp. KACC 22773 TaxID=3025671 RepID=UPI00236642BC|nr:M23 family metallopeptidase [Mucilaginibacter sp. KACC 22773]WDF80761.1 M23 family metallopeptidase [Mucilaginibacter sp. KACC 22773]